MKETEARKRFVHWKNVKKSAKNKKEKNFARDLKNAWVWAINRNMIPKELDMMKADMIVLNDYKSSFTGSLNWLINNIEDNIKTLKKLKTIDEYKITIKDWNAVHDIVFKMKNIIENFEYNT